MNRMTASKQVVWNAILNVSSSQWAILDKFTSFSYFLNGMPYVYKFVQGPFWSVLIPWDFKPEKLLTVLFTFKKKKKKMTRSKNMS